jgi:hypothetical protein
VVLQEHYARCSECSVINIKQQVYHIGAATEEKQGCVRFGLNKSQGEEVCGEQIVPSSRRLLQLIKKLVKVIDSVRLHGINKPRQLAVVDCLQESTM